MAASKASVPVSTMVERLVSKMTEPPLRTPNVFVTTHRVAFAWRPSNNQMHCICSLANIIFIRRGMLALSYLPSLLNYQSLAETPLTPHPLSQSD